MPMCGVGMASLAGLNALGVALWSTLGLGVLAATAWVATRFASGFRLRQALAGSNRPQAVSMSPEDILRERYARGEIGIETLRSMLTELYRNREEL